MNVPLSVLDLSPVSEGADATTALRNSIDLAQHAEQWGYRRYWLAEHHFVAVASTVPALVIAHIAAATHRIRVGAGAVQIASTTPAAVVESFGILDALYPGRIDLGLGRTGHRIRDRLAGNEQKPEPAPAHEVDGLFIPRAPTEFGIKDNPKLRATAAALQQPGAYVADFDQQVADIQAFLDGSYVSPEGVALHIRPGEGADLPLWLFGSSKGESAQVAARRGLPFVANYHVTPWSTVEAVEAYRDAFQPSKALAKPYVIVSADAVAADDETTARHLTSTFGRWVHSIRSGHGAIPYPDPDVAQPLTEEERQHSEDRVATQFVGDAGQVAERLDTLARVTGADELVITSITHRHEDRRRSYELIAKEWGLI
ncbi:Putative monooxygenase (luciferase-like) [Mycobacteroides abscessus subsp. bolletii]|uniref:LLM class flavin-dependent oxidoreductase n=1 Tax=Mycobacteroides abscessus TaxID=36809 RepID=UPI000926A483|nr:LLM class flavin-dependent oxidoreductase [Mycobacteroides abscessus]SII10325.1 Putative monooxygenase (luciferase-like) [Mycobacteroides abscessus subsp. bolletii]SKK04253.1 Putative monooxygenase (luciferase-like) [Mycobacteroides abscessus subsp. bolletii]SLD30005.1 Putative monooxygenase (luciferase-like) [Mycobacteroides abscessus subsp. bolletii]SLE03384.1 Putative monooxygenase (luciferase-like) [Mycobacteroides abscessus subsp. bolletii]